MEFITKNSKQFKANLHSHSVLSDGKLEPAELKRIYKEKGYSILSITDHEYPCSHNDLTSDDFLMLTGYEAYIRPSKLCVYDKTKPEIHINLIARDKDNVGIVAYDPFYAKYMPLDKQMKAPHFGRIGRRKFRRGYIQRFINAANDNGYLVSLNHPCWSMQSYKDVLKLKNFWSMEIFNTGSMVISDYAENMPLYDSFMRQGTFMYCHGADDNHNKKELSDPLSDSFGAWTMVIADELNYESVIKALEEGKFYASTGPTIKRLEFKDGLAYIETTPAKRITMHITPKSSKVIYDKEGGLVTEAKIKLPKDVKYVYFSVTDSDNVGKAYTHAFML